jgi:hypothetical protein
MNKSESMNLVTACIQIESCVIKATKYEVWELLQEFDLAKLFPSHIKSMKFVKGGPREFNSFFEVTYKDQSVWTFRITEISQNSKSSIAFELVSTSTPIQVTSMWQRIQLNEVTEDNSTFLIWETEYSNDVNSHIIQDGKFKKLDYFKDLRKLFNC